VADFQCGVAIVEAVAAQTISRNMGCGVAVDLMGAA